MISVRDRQTPVVACDDLASDCHHGLANAVGDRADRHDQRSVQHLGFERTGGRSPIHIEHNSDQPASNIGDRIDAGNHRVDRVMNSGRKDSPRRLTAHGPPPGSPPRLAKSCPRKFHCGSSSVGLPARRRTRGFAQGANYLSGLASSFASPDTANSPKLSPAHRVAI